MSQELNKTFGQQITRLIQKKNLSRIEAKEAFAWILDNRITEMQQGAFLAALTAKGETKEEVAGAWEAIYELDTEKVSFSDRIEPVENSGTGMDTFKTFNISTAAALVAAAGGIPMARHGARAITSVCGTVDMAEALGVDVECSAEVVAGSIQKAGIGLFNGMSPQIHPRGLGRILSQIHFGSTLNIAASLANPALPRVAVRGVYAKEMIPDVTLAMREIGYTRAVVLHGEIDSKNSGMDEASVCGRTHCAEIKADGTIAEFVIDPKKLGLSGASTDDLAPQGDITTEARRFVHLLCNRENGIRKNTTILNAGLIYYVADRAPNLAAGIEQATHVLESGAAFNTLEEWVQAQTADPEAGLATLHRLV